MGGLPTFTNPVANGEVAPITDLPARNPPNSEVRPLSITRASRRIRMLMPIETAPERGSWKLWFGGLPGRRLPMLIFKVVIAGRCAAKSCFAK